MTYKYYTPIESDEHYLYVNEIGKLFTKATGLVAENGKPPYGRLRTVLTQLEKERGEIKVTVHVKGKHYRLTHLLEKGHLNRDGTTRSKAIPHISIAQEHANKKAEKLLEGL